VADRFRLVYLKSTGLEKSDLSASFSSREKGEMSTPSSPPAEYNTQETLSSEAILKQAQADLKHPDPKIRILAIKYYLEKTYPSIPMSVLQEMLSDRDSNVRVRVLRSLMRFRSPIVSPVLSKQLRDRDPAVRITCPPWHVQYHENDLNLLLQFLTMNFLGKRKVATLLGWTQMEGALPILMEMSRDQEPMVRKAALFSLVTLYPDESENRLMEAMVDSDPGLRKWARITLEKTVTSPVKTRMGSISNQG
jgi:HEAT repeat protein